MGLEPITIPAHLQINPAALERVINAAIEEEAESIQDDYKSSSADFSNPPDFYIQKQGKYGRLIATRDEKFHFTTEGTAPHEITAGPGKVLAFRANYQRKTIVGQPVTRPGGASGPMIYTQSVMHPGYPGTHINKTIADDHEQPFRRRLEQALANALPTK